MWWGDLPTNGFKILASSFAICDSSTAGHIRPEWSVLECLGKAIELGGTQPVGYIAL